MEDFGLMTTGRKETVKSLDTPETLCKIDELKSTPAPQATTTTTAAHPLEAYPTLPAPEGAHKMLVSTESPVALEADTFDRYDRSQLLMAKHNLDLAVELPRKSRMDQERVTKPIRMRIRWTCHRCHSSFGHDRNCVNTTCRHHRCQNCTRYPPRKRKPTSAAEPSVAVIALPEETLEETHELYKDHSCTCHECQTTIEIMVDMCPNCNHKICERCIEESAKQAEEEAKLATHTNSVQETSKSPPEEKTLSADGEDPPKQERDVL